MPTIKFTSKYATETYFKKQKHNKIPVVEWIKFFGAKIIHITLYLGVPLAFSPLPWSMAQ
jgi:hypothetical protein